MKKAIFSFSIRCYYPNRSNTEHRQDLKLSEVPKWIKAYKFTHPECQSITIKIWFTDLDKS